MTEVQYSERGFLSAIMAEGDKVVITFPDGRQFFMYAPDSVEEFCAYFKKKPALVKAGWIE